LDFLGAWAFRCEKPDRDYWISLDFLGFSRQNRDLSMGYGDKSAENFLIALDPLLEARGLGSHDLGMWKDRLGHEVSLM
jgi:hypothetical protein